MKKIAIVLAGAFLSTTTLSAVANTNENIVIESKYDGNKTKVEKEELPQEVIQSLEESEYQNWEIQEAYKVKDEMTNEVHYELHLASDMDAENIKNVTISEDGEILSEEDADLGRTEDQEFEQNEQPQTEPGFEGTEPGIDQDDEVEPGFEGEGTEPGFDGTEQQY
jgi:hypothetical protein